MVDFKFTEAKFLKFIQNAKQDSIFDLTAALKWRLLYKVAIGKTWFGDSSEFCRLSVIRQKGESPNGCFKKTKHPNFPKNESFLPPDMHTYVLWRAFFSGNTCFKFALSFYYRRDLSNKLYKKTDLLYGCVHISCYWSNIQPKSK